MTQAIITKYLGPSATKSARVKASCDAGSIALVWDYALNTDENHKAAVTALVTKLDWLKGNTWHLGWLGNQMVAVRGD